jgi:hypothetical protein
MTWNEFKALSTSLKLSIQLDKETEIKYLLSIYNGPRKIEYSILKTEPKNESQIDFEDNFLSTVNGLLSSKDIQTDGLQFTPKYAPTGWKQQRFETEFETSQENSVHEKDWQNQDIGWSSLKFYKLVDGEEVECINQTDCDTNCIRTDLEWMPNIDYMIKGGWVAQFEELNENLYVWTQGVVLPDVYGGPQFTFAEGGINMRYLAARDKTGLDGVAGTILYYEHPLLGPGIGTNKFRFIVRHPAGKKHRLQCIMDIFRA